MINRYTVEELDAILGVDFHVLDHGFVRVVDYMGGDGAVVQAARVSYGGGTRTLREDSRLIRYLMRNSHTSPFEMCELKIHVKLPLFVARQWIRHRTASVNECSGRYSVMEDEFYVPTADVIAPQSAANMQGRSANSSLTQGYRQSVSDRIKQHGHMCYKIYQELLEGEEEEEGIARELARMVLPSNIYTQWYWKIDAHNLLKFILLRLDSHAQFEIRKYAEVLSDIMKVWMPVTWEAFVDYCMGSMRLTRSEQEMIGCMLNGEQVNYTDFGVDIERYNRIMSYLTETL